MGKAFRVLSDRIIRGTVFARRGEKVFAYRGYDYGLCSDDEFFTGLAHTAVSNNEDGSDPFFTIPTRDLEAL